MIFVGMAFIFLAYNIVDKYQENEELKYEAQFKSSIRNILNSEGRTAGIEENSLTPFENIFRDKSVTINCIENIPVLWINDGEIADVNNEYLKNYPVFMTYINQEKFAQIYIAIESFRMPFKTTNMMAIVSKKNLIIFNNQSKVSDKFLYKFGKGSYDELHLEVRDFEFYNYDMFMNDFSNLNLNSVMFVTDSNETGVIRDQLDRFNYEAYYLEVDEQEGGAYGTLTYYDGSGNSYSYNYLDYDFSLGIPTMAVFSSPYVFDCSYNKIIESINSTYNFYINKAYYTTNISKTEWVCSAGIGAMEFQKQNYDILAERMMNIQSEVDVNKFGDLAGLYYKLKELDIIVEELEDFNCLYVY